MPTYMTFSRWTQEGAREMKNSPSRLDAGRKLFEESGVKILHFYMTTGRYDMVTISEAPNDEAMAKATLTLLGKGRLTTETVRAFTEEEYRKIMGEL